MAASGALVPIASGASSGGRASIWKLRAKEKPATHGATLSASFPTPGLFGKEAESLRFEKASVQSGGSFLQRAASKWIRRKIAAQERITFLEKKALPPVESEASRKKSGFAKIASSLKKKFASSENVQRSASNGNAGGFEGEYGGSQDGFSTRMQHPEHTGGSSSEKKKKGKWKKIKSWLGSGAAAGTGLAAAASPASASVTRVFPSSKPELQASLGGGNGNGNRFGGGGEGGGGGDGNGGDGPASNNNGSSLTEMISQNEEENDGRSFGSDLPLAFISGSLPKPSPRTPSRQTTSNAVQSSSPKEGDDEEDDENENEDSERGDDAEGYHSPEELENNGEDIDSDSDEEFVDSLDDDFKEARKEDARKNDQASLAIQKLKDWMDEIVQSFKNIGWNKEKELEEKKERETMATQTAKLVLRLLDLRTGEDAFAQRSEVSVLRRLQREAFSELLKLKERAEKLESFTGLRHTNADQTNNLSSAEPSRTRLTGQVGASVALVTVPEDEKELHASRIALDNAGMRSGLTTKFRFETLCRDSDLLVTECVSGLGEISSSVMLGGPITLQKVIYYASIAEGILLKVAPMGAKGSDFVEPLNPIQEEGLTKFSSNGVPLLNKSQGSAIGLSLKSDVASFSASQFISGWGVTPDSDPENSALCTSSLLQLTLQPRDFLNLSFSGLYRKWPAPPPPTSSGMHWSEMGPLVLPKLRLWPSHNLDQSSIGSLSEGSRSFLGDLFYGPGASLQCLSLSGCLGLFGKAKLSGWVQAENADWLSDEERSRTQWALTLSRQTKQPLGLGWGISLGSSRSDVASQVFPQEMEGSPDAAYRKGGPLPPPPQPVQAEAFLELALGRGFKLQPGVVYAHDGKNGHNAIVVRSTWNL